MILYSYVGKYSNFPVGHPKIHVGDACRYKHAMLSKERLIKCTVLPPKRLYHPVLTLRCNNKKIISSMHDVRSRMQFFRRMRTRIDSAKFSNVNVGPS